MSWLLQPISSPEHVANAQTNVAAQRCSGMRVLVVENGEAIGMWQGPCDVKLVCPIASKKAALNLALSYLKTIGERGLWRLFDEDDYYSPYAAYQSFRTLRTTVAELTGQVRHWAVLDGRLWSIRYNGTRTGLWKNKPPPEFWGGTLGGRIDAYVPFGSDIDERVDCIEWVTRRMREGQRLALTQNHECFNRCPLSVWRTGSTEEALCTLIQPGMPPARNYGRVDRETLELLVQGSALPDAVTHNLVQPHEFIQKEAQDATTDS